MKRTAVLSSGASALLSSLSRELQKCRWQGPKLIREGTLTKHCIRYFSPLPQVQNRGYFLYRFFVSGGEKDAPEIIHFSRGFRRFRQNIVTRGILNHGNSLMDCFIQPGLPLFLNEPRADIGVNNYQLFIFS